MTRIAICGDSYSAVNDLYTCNYDPPFTESYSWIHELQKRYDVTCYAKSGSSNLDVVMQIKRAAEYDLLIVNLTHIIRLSLIMNVKKAPEVDERSVVKRNLELAEWIAKRPHSICWSPFPGYEKIPSVYTMYFERENELYNKNLQGLLTKHHMTHRGNQLMAEWILDQIEKRVN